MKRGPSVSEAEFRSVMKGWGYDAYRNGWPDFVLEARDGELMLVEVKAHHMEPPRKEQRKMCELLARLGIVVRFWSPDRPGDFVPWSKWSAPTSGTGKRGRPPKNMPKTAA